MPFRPIIDSVVNIGSSEYRFTEHPSAKGMPYGQTGRRATVYQVQDEQGAFHAFKIFTKAFRVAHNATGAQKLQAYASLPGLQVCARQVITRQDNPALLDQNPDLEYAVLMPWVQGLTWQEIMLARQPLTREQSLSLARAFAHILATMEQRQLAHCDLSASNLLIDLPALSGGGGVALVDVEDLYAPNLERPDKLPGGSSGYAHKIAVQGLWSAEADCFAGAVLLAEMLAWHDERVRRIAVGEQYFDAGELQTPCDRYQLLQSVLQQSFGAPADLLARAWYSNTLQKAPTLADWAQAIGQEVPQPMELFAMNINSSLTDVTRPLYESLKANLAAGNWQEAINQAQALQLLAPGLSESSQLLAQAQSGLEQEKQRIAGMQRHQIAEEKAALQARLRELEQAEQALPAASVLPIQAVVGQTQPVVAESSFPTPGLWMWTPLVILGWVAVFALLEPVFDQFFYYWDWEWEHAGRMLAFLGLLGGFSLAWGLKQEKYISSWKAGVVSVVGFACFPVLFPLPWDLLVYNWLEPAVYFFIGGGWMAFILKHQNKSLSWISVGLMALGWGLGVVISWYLTHPYDSDIRLILYGIITAGIGWSVTLWRLRAEIKPNFPDATMPATHTAPNLWRWTPLVMVGSAVGLLIGFEIGDTIGSAINWTIGYTSRWVISWAILGLCIGWALKSAQVLSSWKRIALVVISWAIGWGVIGFATHDNVASVSILAGGLCIGWALKSSQVLSSWNQVALATIGWAIGWAIGILMGESFGEFSFIIGSAIGGTIGWVVVVWQVQQTRKVFRHEASQPVV